MRWKREEESKVVVTVSLLETARGVNNEISSCIRNPATCELVMMRLSIVGKGSISNCIRRKQRIRSFLYCIWLNKTSDLRQRHVSMLSYLHVPSKQATMQTCQDRIASLLEIPHCPSLFTSSPTSPSPPSTSTSSATAFHSTSGSLNSA